MKCPHCNIPVKIHYFYCPYCGANLQAQGWFWKIFGLTATILMLALAVLFYLRQTGYQARHGKDIGATPPDASSSTPEILYTSPQPGPVKISLPMGMVTIEDIAGNIIARLPAAVSASGWVALPAGVCMGGYNWFFRFQSGGQVEIIGGIIGDEDEAGIWQLKNIGPNAGLSISPGNMNQSFTWFSISSDKTMEINRPPVVSEQQNFYRIAFSPASREPGVFIQKNNIVGWSFGDLTEGGFIWKGTDESNLVFELTVSDYYRSTFENSREEQFILAYSVRDTDPLKELEYFANGFRRAPKMLKANTPAHLKPEAVVNEMRLLVAKLILSGSSYDVAGIFDASLFSRIGDVGLLTDVLSAVVQIRGFENTVNILEDVLQKPRNFNKIQVNQIRQFQKEMYKQWLSALANDGEYAKGLDVYRRSEGAFVDDPEIHLLGAKFALSFDDWETALKILRSHQFPIEFTDQVKALESRIAQIKSEQFQEEDKIVIHFAPGSGRIPVTAVLNQAINQNFIVDTGASMVTISTQTARRLGIDVETVPVRQLITAGGMITAPEVTLDSIQIGGWVEKNVNAFIIDMPDQSGAGLLGLNYLHRFRMELNTQAGVLTLTPR